MSVEVLPTPSTVKRMGVRVEGLTSLWRSTISMMSASSMELMAWPEGRFVPVLPFLDIGFIYNRGVSFGLLGSLPVWAVGIVVAVALTALVIWWARSSSTLVRVGLAICIGGAGSNAVDRWLFGAVADFFWLHFGEFSLIVFNLADAAITVGVCVLLLDLTGHEYLGRTFISRPGP